MAEITIRRSGELVRGVFRILLQHPDGLRSKEILQALESAVPPTAFESTFYPKWPDTRRYENIVRFATVASVKAGWLVKDKGSWSLTDEGRAAYKAFSDPEAFQREATRLYKVWETDQPDETSEEVQEVLEEPARMAVTLEEAEERAWAEIEDHLGSMSPYDFQEVVAGLLQGMGYFIDWISPPGPDKGIDIVAHEDPLGVRGPRIKVQVKRWGQRVPVDGIRGFMAVLGDSDVGVFVCAGGFTREAESEARRQERRRIMLLDSKRLVELWIEHYVRVPEARRRLLPLRPVHFLAPPESLDS